MRKRKLIFILSITIIIILLALFLLLKRNNVGKSLLKEISELKIFSNEYSSSLNIDYGEEYNKQFLDEIDDSRVNTHLGLEYGKDGEAIIDALKNLGITYVRDDIRWGKVQKANGEYDFTETDKWINKLTENNIKIQIVIGFGKDYQLGNDYKISNDDELQNFLSYVKTIAERYPQIVEYEFWNEPNGSYVTEEDFQWYAKSFIETEKLLKSINSEIVLIAGSTMTPDEDQENRRSSEKFIEAISSYGIYQTKAPYSIHIYDWDRSYKWNTRFKNVINNHKELFNNLGGFTHCYMTETGIPSTNNSEEKQAEMLIQQKVIWDSYSNYGSSIYNFRNRGQNIANTEYNYGLLNYDYSPKPSFYAVKNYSENTNGAEHVGKINLANGLESHVYNKDGSPKIVTWSNTNNKTIDIQYADFVASDIYGEKIENTNGTLTITNSPVYLDNISTKYFYEAIYNTALEKYAEFEEKFSSEIEQVDGLQEQIDKLKEYINSIKNNETETQDKAIEMMHEHFYLGTMILDAFSKEKLNVEYVKVSSMLDMLNDIGNSYEDLITVSATSREAYYTATEELINKAETTINSNADLNIIYPSKILDFAKELHEKSEYIIGLEEENDIKTGLIVSNSLHAYYLADWANDFANIYANKYIKQNPVTVSYSNTDEFTNQDVTVTLNIGSDSKVTNNEGKNTYTFTKNGTFTFEYERRGQAFEEEVTITSIDKEAPTISGVVNGKIYTDSAKPVIKDDNLEKIELLFNGKNTQFNSGNTLKDEGIYNITATDKAGNTISIEFYIVEKGEDGYIVDNGYILNIKQKTKVRQFTQEFNLSTKYVIKRNNSNLKDEDIIATGDILQLKNEAEYVIIVAGDINRDGKVTTYDLSAFRRYILGIRKFDEIESLAADINVDKQELGVKDYTRMRIEILGEY